MAQFLITALLIQLAFALKKRALRWIPLLLVVAWFGFFGYLLSDIFQIRNIVLLFSLSLTALLIIDYYFGRFCAVVGLATPFTAFDGDDPFWYRCFCSQRDF